MAELEQSPEKREFIAKSKQFWNPAKTQAWQDMVWLHDLAQRRRPFDAVVHCLCAPD